MKNKKIALTIGVVFCISVFAGAVYLFNEIFPKAGKIRHPETEEVVSVMLSCSTSDEMIPMNEQYYYDLTRYLSEAKPTRKQSLNDCPTIWPYYRVEIQTGEHLYRYFVYKEGEHVYIEIPYEGIYESKIELLDLVLKYFEEG